MRNRRDIKIIKALEFVVLLDNVLRAAEDPDIGFESPDETLKSFTFRMNRKMGIKTEDLEMCLWSCNLLSEKGKFRHPDGKSFDSFVTKLLRGDTFNKNYNYIEFKDWSHAARTSRK